MQAVGKKSQERMLKNADAQKRTSIVIAGVLVAFLVLVSIAIYNYSRQGNSTDAFVTLSNPPPSDSSPSVTGSDQVKGDSRYPTAEDFTVTDIDGKRFTLSDFKGKIVILDFMGAQCKPCKQQVIELTKVHSAYGDKVEILSISVFGGKGINEELHTFASSYNVKWRIAVDIEGASFKYRITLIPSIIIIDQDGYVRFRHEGVAEAPTIIQEIKAIQGEA